MIGVRQVSPAILLPFLLIACGTEPATADREQTIPPDRTKETPDTDAHPPRSESTEYNDPVPVPYPVNTAGGEDSGFISPDGTVLHFWFTPDVSIPAESQLDDGVTGIWRTEHTGEAWSTPQRVLLQDSGKAALDGCEFVLGDTMWFCTAREGYTGIHWFTATWQGDNWDEWQEADFDPTYQVGELHISPDGSELYFHSYLEGGSGDLDIWVSPREGDSWGPPRNLAAVNSPVADGWPSLSPDGSELWFTRTHGAPALYRSQRIDDGWSEPELMFSGFAGESSIDITGNVYFTHHFFDGGTMREADIYVATPTGR